jgi:DNA-binding MarR family transcriptional regulator
MGKIADVDYRVLLVFRTALRRYLQWSSEESARLGLTSQQHQLLLAVRAHPGPTPPSVRELAEYLLIRHHSAVELVNRVEKAGLLTREVDPSDQRVARLRLTPAGEDLIERLSETHLTELQRIAERLGISQELLEHLSREFAENLLEDMHARPETG